ncbi:hypothetical protein Q8A73_018197 [Channa argus]|nr:hypothetical protein Q8A73_018197 [Channa argus]
MFLFLILMLQFTATINGRYFYYTVRHGEDFALPCEKVKEDQYKCDKTDWTHRENTRPVDVIRLGQIQNISKSKSHRLSVTENCSLLVKNITGEDVGLYTCRQLDEPGQQQGQDSLIYLSVVTITKQKDGDMVKLNCSVWTYGECEYTVKWSYGSENVDEGHNKSTTSQSGCYSTLSFQLSGFMKSSVFDSLLCEVTAPDRQLFTFQTQSSVKPTRTTDNITTSVNDGSTILKVWWLFIIVIVGLAACVITVVTVTRYQTKKGRKTKMNENATDPEDGVSYASISFTKKTNSKVQVKKKDEADDDDDDDAVTYSSVRVSSTLGGASTDPSSIYAAINKPRK